MIHDIQMALNINLKWMVMLVIVTNALNNVIILL
jgi:hypothetical protein